MSMNISFNAGNSGYTNINTNSKQYKAAAKDFLAAHRAEVAKMTPEQKMMYELFGGEEAYMKNVMRNYDSDGNFLNAYGVAGMDATGKSLSEMHQIINVSEEYRQKMFDECKRHFIQENGVANGDTTKRRDVYDNLYRKTKKDDRLAAGYTMQQYERAYRNAFYAAARKADPKWEIGKPIPSGALDGITRESVEANLKKSGSSLDLKI